MAISVIVCCFLAQNVFGWYGGGNGPHHAGEGGGVMVHTKDVMHTPIGGIFAGKATLDENNEFVDPGKINKAIDYLSLYENYADIGDKDRELKKLQAEQNLAGAKREMVARKLDILKRLREQANIEKTKKREVVGARVIPTVVLPLHYPLEEHGRYARRRFDKIKQWENKLQDAQKTISRLHDITDHAMDEDRKGDNKMFDEFFKAGNIDDYAFKVPVVPQQGSSFYFSSPHEGPGGSKHVMSQDPTYDGGSYANNNLHSQYPNSY